MLKCCQPFNLAAVIEDDGELFFIGKLALFFQIAPIQLVSDPRFHGDKFTPAKAGVLRVSGQWPAIDFVFRAPQASLLP